MEQTPVALVEQLPSLDCKKLFRSPKKLEWHVLHAEPGMSQEQGPKQYNCERCGKEFLQDRYLKQHIRVIHPEVPLKYTPSLRNCPLCSVRLTTKYETHFKQCHEIVIQKEEFNFHSTKEFETWKSNVEIKTTSRYVRVRGGLSGQDYIRYYFKCFRSGNFRTETAGLRKPRELGSRKINKFCPAGMTVLKYENDTYKVNYTKTHVGHDNDIRYLPLNDKEREYLAGKIALNMPFEQILKEVENSSSIMKGRNITKKDLHNIRDSFKLDKNLVSCKPRNSQTDRPKCPSAAKKEKYDESDESDDSSIDDPSWNEKNMEGENIKEESSDSDSSDKDDSSSEEETVARKVDFKKRCLKMIDALHDDSDFDVFDQSLSSLEATVVALSANQLPDDAVRPASAPFCSPVFVKSNREGESNKTKLAYLVCLPEINNDK